MTRGRETEILVGIRIAACRALEAAFSATTAGMYLRTIQRRNKDGSVVRYVQLAHNVRHVDVVTAVRQLVDVVDAGEERDARWAVRSTVT